MFELGVGAGEPLQRLLAIGAHSDDLEIGCGGTILALTAAHAELSVHWVVLAAPGDRGAEARASAESILSGVPDRVVEIHEFRDGYLPHTAAAVKDAFERLKETVDPQLVLTHTHDDLHQDHRLVCELTWNTFRDHLILEYEIPKWDGDLGRPNVYVPLSDEQVEAKLELLGRHFGSQGSKHWYDSDVFRGLMRLRGMECRAPSGHAEAFFGRKLRLAVAAAGGPT
jgi:LmbE family N-acetylglucosaminyl deacetylase